MGVILDENDSVVPPTPLPPRGTVPDAEEVDGEHEVSACGPECPEVRARLGGQVAVAVQRQLRPQAGRNLAAEVRGQMQHPAPAGGPEHPGQR